MRPLIQEISSPHTPDSLADQLLGAGEAHLDTSLISLSPSEGERAGVRGSFASSAAVSGCARPGVILLRSALFESTAARYSIVAANPFLTFRSSGSQVELRSRDGTRLHF